MKEASEHVKPVHGLGFFYAGVGFIAYNLVFEYYDPMGYYDAVMRDKGLLERETAILAQNMQEFLNQEEVIVNGEKCHPKVVMVDIGFAGSRKRPIVVFAVRFPAPITPGRNTYENRYEPERIEYDYEAYWIFPPGSRILEVDMGEGRGEEWSVVSRNVLAIYGRKGGVTSGYEKIVFHIPPDVVRIRVEGIP